MSEENEVRYQDEDINVNADDAAGEEAAPAEGEQQPVSAEGAEGAPEDIEGLRQELEAVRQESRENRDKALRAQAEMDNLRKRTSRDVEHAHKYALEKFVNELLPVLDSLELGLDAASNAGGQEDSLREGMELTLKKFRDVLEKFGVTVIDPQGEKFNPEFHEAMSMQEVEGTETNIVISVMQKGYELNGRLIRPAMVIVAK